METKLISLTKDDFIFLDTTLVKMGFIQTEDSDQRKLFRRLGLIPPREITGREVTYSYNNHEYTGVIHTTYVLKENKWRDKGEDSGWVLIRKGDEAVYFARPFQRKKGFILKLLRYAWVTKWKVDNRPLCPKCSAYMYIKRKKNSRQYFWMCDNREFHPEESVEFFPWDYMLPKKALEFVEIRRTYTEKYNERNKKDGVIRKPAPTIRKKWIITKPQNKI